MKANKNYLMPGSEYISKVILIRNKQTTGNFKVWQEIFAYTI